MARRCTAGRSAPSRFLAALTKVRQNSMIIRRTHPLYLAPPNRTTVAEEEDATFSSGHPEKKLQVEPPGIPATPCPRTRTVSHTAEFHRFAPHFASFSLTLRTLLFDAVWGDWRPTPARFPWCRCVPAACFAVWVAFLVCSEHCTPNCRPAKQLFTSAHVRALFAGAGATDDAGEATACNQPLRTPPLCDRRGTLVATRTHLVEFCVVPQVLCKESQRQRQQHRSRTSVAPPAISLNRLGSAASSLHALLLCWECPIHWDHVLKSVVPGRCRGGRC